MIDLQNMAFVIKRVVPQGSQFIDPAWEIHPRHQNAKIKP